MIVDTIGVEKYFTNYKSQRKQAREESSHDWDNIFTIFNQVRDELKEHMILQSGRRVWCRGRRYYCCAS